MYLDDDLYPCPIIRALSSPCFHLLIFCVGLDSEVIYPQGISCTMPEEHQLRLMRAIPGLEKAAIVKPGNYTIKNLTVSAVSTKPQPLILDQ